MDTPADNHASQLSASQILRMRKVWLVPLVLASLLISIVGVIYIGSVINPTGHLHDLPVMVVNQDTGATVNGKPINIGADLANALEQSPKATSRLKLMPATVQQAQAKMNRGAAYATLVIPATLTRSTLITTGAAVPSGSSTPPASATVTLEENQRLGSLGVNLAAGVIAPAVAQISQQIGTKLTPLATPAARSNPVLAGRLADPVTLTTASYRPLPDHSALGLSAFYIALLALLSGFIAGTLINNSIDGALGYASSEIGPHWKHVRPVSISRRQTFLTKWAVAAAAAPLLTGLLLLIAVGALGMYAPHVLLLWALCALGSLMIATGTLALLAAFGSIGQLLAMILLIYLSLASSGGTVPIQALPGALKVVGNVEPLRQVLGGTRAILYFGARGDAGLTHALIVVAAEIVFWAIIGLGVTEWYDRRRLDRISADDLALVDRAIDEAIESRSATASHE
ncbi:MAG: ABC transporter permease [Solirubrobacteraceae bacterium]